MSVLPPAVKDSPALIRMVPFAVFLVLTFCQDAFGGAARYWLYLAKALIGGRMICEMWALVEEMRWRISFAAVFVGVLGFALWVWLDDLLRLMSIDPSFLELKIGGKPWNPNEQFSQNSNLAITLILIRIAGSTLVVPPLEEVFFRSFLYRYIAKKDFERVAVGQFLWVPFIVTSLIFGFEHREWLTGILCGALFQWLVCWKKRLGDAIIAHAITNLLLGIWVVWKDEWHFW